MTVHQSVLAVLLLLCLLVPLVGSGCAGALALLQFYAAASTISSWLDTGGDTPRYALAGYVFIDRVAGKIAVKSSSVPPDTGQFEIYARAPLSIDTLPPRTGTSDFRGYFEFKSIEESRVVLTVLAPDGDPVRFNVRLDSASIEPAAH